MWCALSVKTGAKAGTPKRPLWLGGGVRGNRGGVAKRGIHRSVLENRSTVHLYLKYAPPIKTSADWDLGVGWFIVHHCFLTSDSVQIRGSLPKIGPVCRTNPIHSG